MLKHIRNDSEGLSHCSEKRSNWEFFSGPEGDWFWDVTHPDGAQAGAGRGFRTLKQCVEDAKQHGYVPWPAEAERRKEPHSPARRDDA